MKHIPILHKYNMSLQKTNRVDARIMRYSMVLLYVTNRKRNVHGYNIMYNTL